ncbi:MAG: ABC transporter ATP-binding protein [Acidobacteria bacterium]|nr:MAG: ABC transporter ATP-binding protein [Acidobacteriota bacterium]RPJ63419.1 MAG: ABC transporter ATP-binding protein [Acidobacteriota bacterium]
MSNLVEVAHLFKSFRSGDEKLEILVDLELQVRQGAMISVTGASGSGKSTFLHLVGGIDTPDSGTITIAGQDISRLDKSALARFRNRHVGFVFQFHHLLPEFSALENVMFPLLLRGRSRSEALSSAVQLLQEVGLTDRGDHRPGELSGGEQQRVAVARALAGNPSLLLGDEPTGNLDISTAETIHRLLIEVHSRHDLTSIIVTHNARLAQLCDLEYRMIGGRLVPADQVPTAG